MKNITKKEIQEEREQHVYEYDAVVERIIDGDTVYLKLSKSFSFKIDFGFHIKETVIVKKESVIDFRLLGINAPEMNGNEKIAGEAAKVALENLILNEPLRVETMKTGKYGRWLAKIFIKNEDSSETDVNQWMIDNGFAVIYNIK